MKAALLATLTCGLFSAMTLADDYQPDLLVGETRDDLKGDNKYLGGSQKVKIETEGKAKFFVRVENDGDLADAVKMRGRKGNRHFDVNYFDESNGDANITAALIRGNYVTPILGSGEGLFIRGEVEFKPRERRGQGKGKGGKRRHFKVRGVSENDTAARDIVRAFVRTGKPNKSNKGRNEKP